MFEIYDDEVNIYITEEGIILPDFFDATNLPVDAQGG